MGKRTVRNAYARAKNSEVGGALHSINKAATKYSMTHDPAIVLMNPPSRKQQKKAQVRRPGYNPNAQRIMITIDNPTAYQPVPAKKKRHPKSDGRYEDYSWIV